MLMINDYIKKYFNNTFSDKLIEVLYEVPNIKTLLSKTKKLSPKLRKYIEESILNYDKYELSPKQLGKVISDQIDLYNLKEPKYYDIINNLGKLYSSLYPAEQFYNSIIQTIKDSKLLLKNHRARKLDNGGFNVYYKKDLEIYSRLRYSRDKELVQKVLVLEKYSDELKHSFSENENLQEEYIKNFYDMSVSNIEILLGYDSTKAPANEKSDLFACLNVGDMQKEKYMNILDFIFRDTDNIRLRRKFIEKIIINRYDYEKVYSNDNNDWTYSLSNITDTFIRKDLGNFSYKKGINKIKFLLSKDNREILYKLNNTTINKQKNIVEYIFSNKFFYNLSIQYQHKLLEKFAETEGEDLDKIKIEFLLGNTEKKGILHKSKILNNDKLVDYIMDFILKEKQPLLLKEKIKILKNLKLIGIQSDNYINYLSFIEKGLNDSDKSDKEKAKMIRIRNNYFMNYNFNELTKEISSNQPKKNSSQFTEIEATPEQIIQNHQIIKATENLKEEVASYVIENLYNSEKNFKIILDTIEMPLFNSLCKSCQKKLVKALQSNPVDKEINTSVNKKIKIKVKYK